MELCSSVVDPFLTGLFDDPDNGVYLRWIDETTLTAKKADISSRPRPDRCITKSGGVKWTSSLAYATFCKEALDEQLFKGILAIQVIGRAVMFYVHALPGQSLYTLISLARVRIPDSLETLPSMVTEVPAILKVLDVFDRLCVPASQSEVIA
ncbi:uncharacterized protein BYT42DRAFT_611592 [Radiomyces spectabilis]|uniref:uncharacterized protein n=1 Tax=Radiomyces spectabilis TaxID=64574 RepID=UPI00221E87DE|nr:uncharacterized protein BYT42DRAFT_611592 [Radiomyces spectabilis]KAI8388561.1 hypothetical protein BYT42DRAFT_611592 [Radiomyces spectabilis]